MTYAKYTGKEEKNFDDSFRQHQKQDHQCHFYFLKIQHMLDDIFEILQPKPYHNHKVKQKVVISPNLIV